MIGALALREEIGEHRMLDYYYEQQISRLVLDDRPRLDASKSMLLDELLRAYDEEMAADAASDVVGPLVIDQARARELAERYGAVIGDINLATVDFDEHWPPHKVMLVVGAHVAVTTS